MGNQMRRVWKLGWLWFFKEAKKVIGSTEEIAWKKIQRMKNRAKITSLRLTLTELIRKKWASIEMNDVTKEVACRKLKLFICARM